METIEAIKSKYGNLSGNDLLAVIARLLSENGYLKSLLYTGRSERRREEPTDIKPLFDEVEDEAGAHGSEPSEDSDQIPAAESAAEDDKPRKKRGATCGAWQGRASSQSFTISITQVATQLLRWIFCKITRERSSATATKFTIVLVEN